MEPGGTEEQRSGETVGDFLDRVKIAVDCENKSPADIVNEIIKALESWRLEESKRSLGSCASAGAP